MFPPVLLTRDPIILMASQVTSNSNRKSMKLKYIKPILYKITYFFVGYQCHINLDEEERTRQKKKWRKPIVPPEEGERFCFLLTSFRGSEAAGSGSLLRELKNGWESWGKSFCKVCVKSVGSYTDCAGLNFPVQPGLSSQELLRIFLLLSLWEVEHPGLYQLQTVFQMGVFTNLSICNHKCNVCNLLWLVV